MKIISFITEKDIIRKILEHLDLWEGKIPTERVPPVPIRDRDYGPFDDGWPGYEEPAVTIHCRLLFSVYEVQGKLCAYSVILFDIRLGVH